MFGAGLFGDLFDFDGDGKLDAFEQASEFMAFEEMIKSDEDSNEDEDDNESFDFCEDYYDEDE